MIISVRQLTVYSGNLKWNVQGCAGAIAGALTTGFFVPDGARLSPFYIRHHCHHHRLFLTYARTWQVKFNRTLSSLIMVSVTLPVQSRAQRANEFYYNLNPYHTPLLWHALMMQAQGLHTIHLDDHTGATAEL